MIAAGNSGPVLTAGTKVGGGTPLARFPRSAGGPPFVRWDESGIGAYVEGPPDRITRLFYPNINTSLAGRTQFSGKQTASEAWLPPRAVPHPGTEVRAIRNRNVLRPSASTSFIPSVFVPGPGRS